MNRISPPIMFSILVCIVLALSAIGVFVMRLSSSQPAAVLLSEATTTEPTAPAEVTVQPTLYDYLEVTDGCGPYYAGTCVNMRSGPSTTSPVVERLRTGVVLKVAGSVRDAEGVEWYKIDPGANLRYPERVAGGWYVLAGAVQAFKDDGDHHIQKGEQASTTKRIVVDLSAEMLTAYDGETVFMQEPISTGLDFTPTPLGTFSIYAKTPSRYMQGPIPGVSSQSYDLPGVPWDLYFTKDGAVIHGAYWHDHFGEPWSHGCVNLAPQLAKKLYYWADIGTPVVVVP